LRKSDTGSGFARQFVARNHLSALEMRKLLLVERLKRNLMTRPIAIYSQRKERIMPLDPDKLREASERAQNLSKRFDAFIERRKVNSEDDPEDEDEEDEDDEELTELAEEAREATPGSDLANPADVDEPWYGRNQ
jgi:hypothetical protein